MYHTGKPAYLQVADDLREQIRSGELAPGDALPSTTRLAERYCVSIGVVRMAMGVLRTEGLTVGQQGKAVFVRDGAEPADALSDLRAELAALTERVERLERAVRTRRASAS